MATVAPDFIQAMKSDAVSIIKAHFSPNGNVGDGIVKTIGFAENVSVPMASERFSFSSNASEHTSGSGTLVGPLAESVVNTIGDGNGLRYAWKNNASNSVSGNSRLVFLGKMRYARHEGAGIVRANIIHPSGTRRKIPTCDFKFTSVGV